MMKKKRNTMHHKVRNFFIKFINLFSWVVFLGCICSLMAFSSILITNVANEWRLTGHLDLTFGVSIISILLIVVWVPIWLTLYLKEPQQTKRE